MPTLQGLIFDLEGTLIDGTYDLRKALNATMEQNGRSALTLDEVRAIASDGMLPMVHRAFAATGDAIPDTESYTRFQGFINHYRTQEPDPDQIVPGMKEELEAFAEQNILLGLCTNNPQAATQKLLDALDLARFFTFMAGGDTFPFHKPNPGHVLGVIERLGIPAAACVMIGDTLNDVTAAHGAKIPCIAIGANLREQAKEWGADTHIAKPSDLRPALTKLGFAIAQQEK